MTTKNDYVQKRTANIKTQRAAPYNNISKNRYDPKNHFRYLLD